MSWWPATPNADTVQPMQASSRCMDGTTLSFGGKTTRGVFRQLRLAALTAVGNTLFQMRRATEYPPSLRAQPKSQPGHVPIIALTANVMGDHRDRCIREGMDDFLAKPVELDQPQKMLLKWLAAFRDREEIQATAGAASLGSSPCLRRMQPSAPPHE